MVASPQELIRRLSVWKGVPRLVPMSGGLSNENFKVTDDTGRFVVRFGQDYAFHHVDRGREARAAHAAYICGLSPEVIHAQDGIMVLRFIDAKTFTEADVRASWRACLQLVENCHRKMGKTIRGPAGMFWVFHVLRDYAATLVRHKHAYASHLNVWMDITHQLEAAQQPMPIVFGHHDLLAANVLDDGQRLWLVDWEYGAFGTPLFDLANLAANNGFEMDLENAMLTAYFGGTISAELRRAYDAMKVASALREAMWGMVSEIHLAVPGVNYVEYAAMQVSRFEKIYQTYREKYLSK
jgi:thiamine kinase-like enzyme